MNYYTKEIVRDSETLALESGAEKIFADNLAKLNMEEAVQVYKSAMHVLPQQFVPYVESWLNDRHLETGGRSRGMTTMRSDRRKVSRKNPKNL